MFYTCSTKYLGVFLEELFGKYLVILQTQSKQCFRTLSLVGEKFDPHICSYVVEPNILVFINKRWPNQMTTLFVFPPEITDTGNTSQN